MDDVFLISLLVYLLCGALAGFLGGLLGIGGGVVIVAILLIVLPTQGVGPEHLYHIAIGTSLASIIITSLSSSYAHYKRGAVRLDILRNITPGILAGTFVGSLIASYMPHTFLQIFITCFLYFVGSNMLFNFIKPKGEHRMPGLVGTSAAGSVIGLFSSWVGVGGGTMSTPFMMYCGVPMITAVGTAAAIGVPISIAGTIGYIVGGWGDPTLPPGTLGYIHIAALVTLALGSILMAPIGVRVAHALPVKVLRRIFAVFLLVMATQMLWKVFSSFSAG